MDNQENLIIFDVKLMNSVEKSDVCKRQILCQSINALSSKLNFEAVYHYSVQSFKGRLCVLVSIIIYKYINIFIFIYIYIYLYVFLDNKYIYLKIIFIFN